jgi:hypothetical protein
MDQSTLVGEKIDAGRRFIERFVADGNPVLAAFWAKLEDSVWFLYVATELADTEGPAGSYRAVNASLAKGAESEIGGSEIKIVSPNKPIVKKVLAAMARYPGRSTVRLGDSSGVEQVYIYPHDLFSLTTATRMTAEDVGRALLRLMDRGAGNVHPSRIALKDGSTFRGVPFSVEVGVQQAMVVRFLAEGESAPRVVPLNNIASVN